MDYEPEWQAALEAAKLAGEVLREEYQRFQEIPDAPVDISTIADRKSQETIIQYLQKLFPDDAYCGEEDTPSLQDAEKDRPRTWIIDPIDGTRGFARKNGEFSVMIGFTVDNIPQVGVVAEPAIKRTTYAVRGQGCWVVHDEHEPQRCHVGMTADIAAATLTQSHSKSPDQPSKPVCLLHPQVVKETYSAGIKLALVARGEADLYVNTYDAFHDWDICAGHILVEEAGGKVTGLNGETIVYGSPGAWQKSRLLATNGVLHATALEGLRGL